MPKGKNKQTQKPVRRAHPITVMLWDAGSSVGEVARSAKVSSAHVTQVCQGKNKSARIAAIIEKILGKTWKQIQTECVTVTQIESVNSMKTKEKNKAARVAALKRKVMSEVEKIGREWPVDDLRAFSEILEAIRLHDDRKVERLTASLILRREVRRVKLDLIKRSEPMTH